MKRYTDSAAVEEAKKLILRLLEGLVSYSMYGYLLGVIEDIYTSGAPAAKSMHHAYRGGLMIHTAEVLTGALGLYPKGREVLVPAAILHDVAKIDEYRFFVDENGVERIRKTEYAERVGHVVGSAILFSGAAATKLKMVGKYYLNDILHCLLSHHGRLDFGSPVTPKTPEAWALHLADSMSAFAGIGKDQPLVEA